MGMFAKLTALLSLDASGVKSGADQADTRMKGLGSSLSNIGSMIKGAFGLGAIIAFGRSILQLGDEIQDASERMGISTKSYQVLSRTFDAAGVEAGQFEQAMNRLRVASDEVGNGNAETAKKFQALGMSMSDVIGLSADELLVKVAQASLDAEGNVGKLAEVSDLLGSKVGPKMANTLREIAGGMDEVARNRGITMVTEEDVQLMADLDQTFKDTGRDFKVAGSRLLGALLDPIETARKAFHLFKGDIQYFQPPQTSGRDAVAEQAKMRAEQEAIEAIQKRISAENLKDASITERIVKAQADLADLKRKEADYMVKGMAVDALLMAEEEIKKQRELNKLVEDRASILEKIGTLREQRGEVAAGKNIKGRAIEVDSLAKIGGFMGAQVNPMLGSADRALQINADILEWDKKNAATLAKMEKSLGDASKGADTTNALLASVDQSLKE